MLSHEMPDSESDHAAEDFETASEGGYIIRTKTGDPVIMVSSDNDGQATEIGDEVEEDDTNEGQDPTTGPGFKQYRERTEELSDSSSSVNSDSSGSSAPVFMKRNRGNNVISSDEEDDYNQEEDIPPSSNKMEDSICADQQETPVIISQTPFKKLSDDVNADEADGEDEVVVLPSASHSPVIKTTKKTYRAIIYSSDEDELDDVEAVSSTPIFKTRSHISISSDVDENAPAKTVKTPFKNPVVDFSSDDSEIEEQGPPETSLAEMLKDLKVSDPSPPKVLTKPKATPKTKPEVGFGNRPVNNKLFVPRPKLPIMGTPIKKPSVFSSNSSLNDSHPPNSPFWKQSYTASEYKSSDLYKDWDNHIANQLPPIPTPSVKSRARKNTVAVTTGIKELQTLLDNIPDEKSAEELGFIQPKQLKITLMDHQLKGVAWLKDQEIGDMKGGILADDMGLGKTVQSISLILSHKSQDPKNRSTLIIAPLALIRQWEEEIRSKTERNSLRVYVHHGPKRSDNEKYLQNFDVVITTYSVVGNEFKKGNESTDMKKYGPLFNVNWFRIILDEAQTIKNKSSLAAKACCFLPGLNRFCLSGTPIQNNISELYSLLKFLRTKTYSTQSVFEELISTPISKGQSIGFDRLKIILKSVLLRRTKTTVIDGKPLFNLPKRNVIVKTIPLTSDEKEFYFALESQILKTVKNYKKTGSLNYTNVLTLLLKLRQACNHPYLVNFSTVEEGELPKSAQDQQEGDSLSSLMSSLTVASSNLCSLCQEPMPETSSISKTCIECIKILAKKIGSESRRCDSDLSAKERNALMINDLKKNWVSSTKVDQLLLIIKESIEEESSTKIIVYSQFTTMLDIIEIPLRNLGYKFCRYDGSMKNEDREISLNNFRANKQIPLMLISLKCGSLGLNLVDANRVILIDPWWNPALEDQAIDRVHRIGQKREVFVTRLTIESSVEDRILLLQGKKRTLIEGALGDSGIEKSKVTMSDLMALFNHKKS